MLVCWTDDLVLSTRINRQVAHLTGQSELAAAIQEGLLAARDTVDLDRATAKLGRAVQLATESGHEEALQRLNRLVEMDGPGAAGYFQRKWTKTRPELWESFSTRW